MQAELVEVGPGRLPIRHQQEAIGHDADQGERDEGKPYEAGTLSCAHGERLGRTGSEAVSPRLPSQKENKPGARSKGRGRGVVETALAKSDNKRERPETHAKRRWRWKGCFL